MTASIRQYGRDDVNYATWYSPWMRQLALSHTRAELEAELYGATAKASSAAAAHERAVKATHSMGGQSQRRAQSRNVAAAEGDHKIALSCALEIYDLFPEHTKEGTPTPTAPARTGEEEA